MTDIDFRRDLLPLRDRLFRLALRITLDRMEAEDVAEDVLVRVWERRESLREVESLEAYCLTTCRNLSLDRSAKAVAQHLSLDDEAATGQTTAHIGDDAHDPQATMEQRERIAAVRAAIATLPETQRTALMLREEEGRSGAEIAAIMHLTEANVKVILCRARRALRSKLAPHL